MITGTFSWVTPTENADPWLTDFEDMVSQIETTVSSVYGYASGVNTAVTSLAQTAHAFAGIVCSVYANTTTFISSASATTGKNGWTVLSMTPYGRCVGSFRLVSSGAQMLATLDATGYWNSAVASFGQTGAVFFRLVVSPGSVNVTTDSAWKIVGGVPTLTRLQLHGSAVASLGPGTFSAELQMRPVTAAPASLWAFNLDDALVLTVLEHLPAR